MVQEAQQGKFHSMQDLKQKIAEWKSKFARSCPKHHSQQSQPFEDQGSQKNQDLTCDDRSLK